MINPLTYDHAGYIAAAYGLFAAATLYFTVGARLRLKAVEGRIAAVGRRPRTGSL